MRRLITILPLPAIVLGCGCGLTDDVVDFGEVIEYDERPVLEAPVPPPPISGGTLIVTDDDIAVAADSDRDRVFIVDLEARLVRHAIVFGEGAEPGRVVEGAGGRGHVLLRGTGALASFEFASGVVTKTRAVCVDPRGIDHDAVGARLFVTCADGTLVTLPEDPAAGGLEHRFIEPDLRDVIVRGDTLVISRFRSVQILEVPIEGDGPIVRRGPIDVDDLAPTSLWRLVRLQPEIVVGLHQYARRDELPIVGPEAPTPELPPYGERRVNVCQPSAVGAAVTLWSLAGTQSHFLSVPTPAVDVAADPDRRVLAIAVPAAADGAANVDFLNLDDGKVCADFQTTTEGQIVAVAFTRSGRLVAQSREPALLDVHGQTGAFDYAIGLDASSVFDTGHDLFHRATPAELACASCHGEGGDDGHVWRFAGLGARRTQPLDVGLAGSEPFHWDGDMEDIAALTGEVFHRRMGGLPQREARVDAFERWLFSIERPASESPVDPAVADLGYEVFYELGCNGCHAGARMSNDLNVETRGESLQVPSLRRVGVRPPYMHDGRAATLRDAIEDMIAETRPDLDSDVDPESIDALEAFLRTR